MYRKTARLALSIGLLAAGAQWSLAQETQYPVTIQNGPYSFTVDQPPQRVISLNAPTTEILLTLGLGDVMVGTAYNNYPVREQNQEAFDRIPVLAERIPSLEVVLGAEPDFTFGRETSYRESAMATIETLQSLGITAMVVEGNLASPTTMTEVYNDIRNLGIIFDIQPRAEALIAELQTEIEEVGSIVSQASEPVDVLVYDSGTESLFTAGTALETHLIALAGGRNVFDDLETPWGSVSWEEAVERNPDVIVINDYDETSADEKRRFLEENEALSSITAIREGRFVVVPLPGVHEGTRNADTVRRFAEGFYPELFDQ